MNNFKPLIEKAIDDTKLIVQKHRTLKKPVICIHCPECGAIINKIYFHEHLIEKDALYSKQIMRRLFMMANKGYKVSFRTTKGAKLFVCEHVTKKISKPTL